MNKISLGILLVVVVGFGAMLVSRSADSAVAQTQMNPPGQKIAAPDFTLEKVGGGQITLSSYKGKKAVVLDFWATWCPNCKRNIPTQQALYGKYQDKVEVIGINLQEDPSIVERFMGEYRISYPIVIDSSSRVSRAFGVQYTNYHVLIDINGDVVKVIPGDIKESDFLSLI